jgi:hypothetical protein
MPGVRFTAAQKAQAVRLVAEATPQHESQWAGDRVGGVEDRCVVGNGA